MTTTFTPPGPGRWELDRSHFTGGATPIAQWLMSAAMEAGMRRSMAEIGIPADCVQARFVHGFMYTRLRPLIAPDKPAAKLPPTAVIKLATRLHPEFRRRTRAALRTERDRPALAIARQWAAEMKPQLTASNRALQVDLATLDDATLAHHLSTLLDHLRETSELHFWLHAHDLGPIARYLHSSLAWGFGASEAVDALAGASPSTSAPAQALARIRAEIDAAGVTPRTLDDVRGASPHAAELLDDYLDRRAATLVSGYDVTDFTLGELPGALLRSITTAQAPVEPDASAIIAALRERVPPGDRARFDLELGDARAVMDMRDDNGPLTYAWPAGLLRLALLEAGRRLTARGQMIEADHALDFTPDEARNPFGAGAPGAAVMAARAARRAESARLQPPDALGAPEPQPPLGALPPILARGVAMVESALAHLGMSTSEAVAPMVGAGVGSSSYRGRVCRAETADEAFERLEPGDVLVVRATSPAFNAVLSIAGAVVTADGGALSHAAVLARELGIPAVVGARGALELTHGAIVDVDPVAGMVRLVEA